MTADRLQLFADAVGADDPICVVGGRTHWDVGGAPLGGVREERAPAGVVSHQPEEMIVRVRAGTTVAELAAAVAESGQMVALSADDEHQATVGGVLAVGRSGYQRLRYGPVRDCLLEARFVNAEGRLVRAGGPLVKNVTGFDLCRLLVGSLGTLGLLAEVVLRCLPQPEVTQWWEADGADPFLVLSALYRPLAVLWDGYRTWVGLAGHPADVADQAAALTAGRTAGYREVEGPPRSPGPVRLSVDPGVLAALPRRLPAGGWLAEIGVGIVHLPAMAREAEGPTPASASSASTTGPLPVAGRGPAGGRPPAASLVATPEPSVVALNRAIKARFDPTGRLNPGRDVLVLR